MCRVSEFTKHVSSLEQDDVTSSSTDGETKHEEGQVILPSQMGRSISPEHTGSYARVRFVFSLHCAIWG